MSSNQDFEELAALAEALDRPGPRYTSYPTAVQFTETFAPEEMGHLLEEAGATPRKPLSAYIHVPFCAHRCAYCACEVIATLKKEVAEAYLEHLTREIALVAGRLGGRRGLRVLHLGGGTPTYLSPAQLERLFAALGMSFHLLPGAEVSVEIDPRVTTREQLRTLRAAGVNRVSLGVQDLDETVQEAMGRRQARADTLRVYAECREEGFSGINFDLLYGLPAQTPRTMAATVEEAARLRPDRVALYGYAHVPWKKPHQESIDASALPGARERLRLFHLASEAFLQAGYEAVGMDHFALPGDEIAVAAREGRLARNFMGYTPHGSMEILGFGVSSISHLPGAYVQNQKKLSRYYQRIDAGELPSERGCRITRDDELRRWTIHEVLCHRRIDALEFERRSGVPFQTYFRSEAEELGRLEEMGLMTREAWGISVTARGRYFLRNVAMVFDRRLRESRSAAPAHSRTV